MARETFFGGLVRDRSGNTFAIAAAAMLPLIAIIGGGVDASRIYLAKSRLQQSCDAATLAARKKAAASEDGFGITDEIEQTAQNFFDANFAEGIYGTKGVSYELSAGNDTQMNGAASVKVPTTLMNVFGFDNADIAVTCSADLNLPNIDVMLVLDNTGSMGGSRIAALKSAVFEFYDEIMSAKPENARIRIGVVPYSTTVNVGSLLMAENPDFVADSFTYQSREAKFELIGNDDAVDEGDVLDEEAGWELLPREPVQLGSDNEAHYHWNDNNEKKKKPECLAYDGQTYDVNGQVWKIYNPYWIDEYWEHWKKGQKAACRAYVRKYTVAGPDDVQEETFTEKFDYWIHKPIAFNTSSFKYGNAVTTPTGHKGADISSTWDGCIEERETVDLDGASEIPEEAFDLDIDLVPVSGDVETQWRPMWPDITYNRPGPSEKTYSSSDSDDKRRYHYCPKAAVRLTEWPLSGGERNAAFEAYINSLNATGNTMHDIGVLWGARLISPTGIFADDNETAPNGDTIARHIIFMTDGKMEPSTSRTTAYGNPDMDGKVGYAPDGSWSQSQLADIHNDRLDLICEAVKNKNITMWAVSFGLPLNSHTRGCATGSARAFEADDSDDLSAAFKKIASSIAELRLVK